MVSEGINPGEHTMDTTAGVTVALTTTGKASAVTSISPTARAINRALNVELARARRNGARTQDWVLYFDREGNAVYQTFSPTECTPPRAHLEWAYALPVGTKRHRRAHTQQVIDAHHAAAAAGMSYAGIDFPYEAM